VSSGGLTSQEVIQSELSLDMPEFRFKEGSPLQAQDCLWALGQENYMITVTPSFSKSSVFKFLYTKKRKSGVFTFLLFEECFRKAPFSWRTSVDGRPNRWDFQVVNFASLCYKISQHFRHTAALQQINCTSFVAGQNYFSFTTRHFESVNHAQSG